MQKVHLGNYQLDNLIFAVILPGLTLASSTGSDTLLAGNITAMLVSGLVAVIVSKVKDGGDKFGWKKTLSINNRPGKSS